MRPLLANPDLRAAPGDIEAARLHFREMLALRKSSLLFRMRTADDLLLRLTFLNTGPDQVPGLIVMTLDDRQGEDLDPNYEHIVALFNANPVPVTFRDDGLRGLALELHPIQQGSADALVATATFDAAAGAFTVPGRTAAVFVLRQAEPEPTAAPPTATARPVDTPAATTTSVPPTATRMPPTATPLPAPTSTPVPAAPAPSPWALVLAFAGALLVVYLAVRRGG
jgi:hypothetical protein